MKTRTSSNPSDGEICTFASVASLISLKKEKKYLKKSLFFVHTAGVLRMKNFCRRCERIKSIFGNPCSICQTEDKNKKRGKLKTALMGLKKIRKDIKVIQGRKKNSTKLNRVHELLDERIQAAEKKARQIEQSRHEAREVQRRNQRR